MKQEKAKVLHGFSLLSIACLFYNYVRRESAEKAIENLNGSKVDVIEELSSHGLEVHIKSRMGKR